MMNSLFSGQGIWINILYSVLVMASIVIETP